MLPSPFSSSSEFEEEEQEKVLRNEDNKIRLVQSQTFLERTDMREESEQQRSIPEASVYMNENRSFQSISMDSSEQVIIFLGSNRGFKEQHICFLSNQFNRRQSQSQNELMTRLDNNLFLINYPMIDNQDLSKKEYQWSNVISTIEQKKIIFTLLIELKQLTLPQENLCKYLYEQYASLSNAISDFDLLLESKTLSVVVSSLSSYDSLRNSQKREFEKELKPVSEIIFKIYWDSNQYSIADNRGFRSFLYYLIEKISTNSYLFWQPDDQSNSQKQFLSQLLTSQKVFENDITLKPPQDVADKMLKDCEQGIMQLPLEQLDNLPSLFTKLSSKTDSSNFEQIYYQKVEVLIANIQEQISKLQSEPSNEYLNLLNDMKALEYFEESMRKFNIKKSTIIQEQIVLIKETLQRNIGSLICEATAQKTLDILKDYSQWNSQFKTIEADFKQQLGQKLNDLLKNIVQRSNQENSSALSSSINAILHILGSYESSQVKDFFSSNQIKEVTESVEVIQTECNRNLNFYSGSLEEVPNFKKMEKDLTYIVRVLGIFETITKINMFNQQILSQDAGEKLQDCRELLEKLKNTLGRKGEQVGVNEKLTRIYYSDQESFKRVYQILDLPLKIDDKAIHSSLQGQIQKLDANLTEAIQRRKFDDFFIKNIKQLETVEKLLSQGQQTSMKIQSSFKTYFQNFIEDYMKKSSFEMVKQMSLLKEKNQLSALKDSMMTKPVFLNDLLSKLTQLK